MSINNSSTTRAELNDREDEKAKSYHHRVESNWRSKLKREFGRPQLKALIGSLAAAQDYPSDPSQQQQKQQQSILSNNNQVRDRRRPTVEMSANQIEGWLYPILIVESMLIGCLLYAALVYGSSVDYYGAQVNSNIIVGLVILIIIITLGSIVVGCLGYGAYKKSAPHLVPYLVWCIAFHLLLGPILGLWSIYAYLNSNADDNAGFNANNGAAENGDGSEREMTKMDVFYIVALIVQFILATASFYAVYRAYRFYRKFAKALLYYTGLRRNREMHEVSGEVFVSGGGGNMVFPADPDWVSTMDRGVNGGRDGTGGDSQTGTIDTRTVRRQEHYQHQEQRVVGSDSSTVTSHRAGHPVLL